MTGKAHDHLLFGLKVRSDLMLPELAPANWVGEPDVRIRTDRIDHQGNGDSISTVEGGNLLKIEEAGRYLVRDGSEIIVDAEGGVDARNVRLFLLGSAFGILLHQRGLLPLHANAVEVDGRAIAFMGPSGSGKSTLAAWFHDHDHAILADDVCVVDFDGEGQARAHAGIPRLRLWIDALYRSGRSAERLHRSYVEKASAQDKFDLPIDTGAPGRTLPLAAIFLLDRGETFAIAPLAGVDALTAVMENTYRGGWVSEAGSAQDHWSAAVRLASSTPVFRVIRPWDADRIGEFAEKIASHADGRSL